MTHYGAMAVDQPQVVGVVVFGDDVMRPTVVQFVNATLEVMVVKRRALRQKHGIDVARWAVPGAYVLIGRSMEPDKRVRARPGQTGDLLKRMNEHLGDEDLGWFDRAVLIRDTGKGFFNTAEIGYIEGVLHDLCQAADAVEHRSRADHDTTLEVHEEATLEAALPATHHRGA